MADLETQETFTASFDSTAQPEWDSEARAFADANLFQTWAYAHVHWGEKNTSRCVLRTGTRVRSLGQCRVVCAPLGLGGIAYFKWGPLYKRGDRRSWESNLRAGLSAIREEYAVRRKLLVRIVPNVCTCDADASSVRRVFEETGFTTRPATYRTYYVDLTQSREQLEAGLSRGWKRSLKKAASQNVEVRIGTSDELFLDYLALYAEMQERKRFLEGVDVYEYRRIQECLAAEDKLQIMVAYVDGRPAAAVIYSYLGEKGIVLIGATGHAGVNLGINHLINLRMIEQGLDVPASWFDYGGYNPEKVPGTARFKSGVPGLEARGIGVFEASSWVPSKVAVRSAELGREATHAIRELAHNARKGVFAGRYLNRRRPTK